MKVRYESEASGGEFYFTNPTEAMFHEKLMQVGLPLGLLFEGCTAQLWQTQEPGRMSVPLDAMPMSSLPIFVANLVRMWPQFEKVREQALKEFSETGPI
jgi:hypothetical protein